MARMSTSSPSTPGIVRCREAFAFWPDGNPRSVTPGMLLSADDPAVKHNPGAFDAVDDHVARIADQRVEQATAAPGEIRSVDVPAEDDPPAS